MVVVQSLNNSFWKQLIEAINVFSVGSTITRQYILKLSFIKKKNNSYGLGIDTLDIYRNYLDKAGYLQSIKRGKYIIVKKPDEKLTLTQCKIEAYGHA